MEMSVKSLLLDARQGQEAKSGQQASAAALPRHRPAPWRWLEAALSSFIDIIEPAAMRFSAGTSFVAVEMSDGEDIEVFSVSRRHAISLGKSSPDPDVLLKNLRRTKVSGVELRLDPERVIRSRFKIPAAGASLARQIIENRLERLTPWKADAILYGFAVSHKPDPDGQLDVDFAATSRAIATANLDRLAKLGLSATTIGPSEQTVMERLRIDLYAGSNDTRRQARRRAIGAIAIGALICAALLCGATFYMAMESRQHIAELDVRLTKARTRLVHASGSNADREQDFAYIATKNPDEARFRLIDRLAGILPDTAYLDELDIEPGSIRIAGSSTAASDLIKILENDPIFRDARFVAPVTRQDDGRDRFEITASYGIKAKDPTP